MINTANILCRGLEDFIDEEELNIVLNQVMTNLKKVTFPINYLEFATDFSNGELPVGSTWFDKDDATFNIKLSESVTANVPTEQLAPRCVNKSGSAIGDGKAVYIDAVQGQRPTIKLANASNYANSKRLIGLTTEPFDNNAEGFVCRNGYVRNLNTSSWEAGTCLYLDTVDGGLTDTPPADGNSKILMGMVMQQHLTQGIICVKVHDEKYRFGDVENGHYSFFDTKGVNIALNDSRLYEDIQFSISSGKVPATNFPTYETLTAGTRAFSFDVNDYIDLETNEPFHGTDFTTTADFHAHLTTKTANTSGSSQFCKVQLVLGYCKPNSTWQELTVTGEIEIPDGTPALYKQIVSVNSSSLDLSLVGLGGQITPVLRRIAATGGTEYADKMFITQVGLHVMRDQSGSRTVSSK